MSTDASILVGLGAAGIATLLAVPVAIAVARRTGFYDRPREYRQHNAPTPFLGGAAVLVGFLVGAIAVGGMAGRLMVLPACAAGLWLLGTVDDRLAVAPKWRLLAEAGAAMALVTAGLGWKTTGGSTVDFVLTIVWIVGLVNAFNLMDNLDGACGTLGCVSACGIGTLAAVHGQSEVAGLAFALAGGCAAFLRWNLAAPAKIFLGDGGSMPIGFLVAALGMVAARHLRVGDANLLATALMVGLVVLDTALVSVSRIRRRVPLVTGGRDHLTHRLLLVLKSPRSVAAILASVQAVLCTAAILGDRLGTFALGASALVLVSLGVISLVVLDTQRWRPPGIATGPLALTRPTASAPPRSVSIRCEQG